MLGEPIASSQRVSADLVLYAVPGPVLRPRHLEMRASMPSSPVEIRTIDVLTVTDGRISEVWVVADELSMLTGLGAVTLA